MAGKERRCCSCKQFLPPTSFDRAKYKRKNVEYNDGLLSKCRSCMETYYASENVRALTAFANAKPDEKWCRKCRKLEPLRSFDAKPKSRPGEDGLYQTCRKGRTYEQSAHMKAKAAERSRTSCRATSSRATPSNTTFPQGGHAARSLKRNVIAQRTSFEETQMRPNFKPSSGGIDSRESSHFSEELDDKDYSTQALLKIRGAVSEYFLQSPDLADDWNNHAMPEDASAMSMQKAHHIRTTTFKPHISAADMDGLVSMLQPLPVESANVDVQQLIRSILRQHEEVAGLASPSMMRETACWGSEVVDRGTYHGAHGDHSTHELHPSSPEVEESVALALSLGESKIDPRMLSQQYFRQLSLL